MHSKCARWRPRSSVLPVLSSNLWSILTQVYVVWRQAHSHKGTFCGASVIGSRREGLAAARETVTGCSHKFPELFWGLWAGLCKDILPFLLHECLQARLHFFFFCGVTLCRFWEAFPCWESLRQPAKPFEALGLHLHPPDRVFCSDLDPQCNSSGAEC